MNKKVYCRDCRNFHWYGCSDDHKVIYIEEDYYSREEIDATTIPELKNKNNDCKYF